MTTLSTVPNFIFKQGSVGDDGWEESIQVQYYRDCISLDQNDNSVNITYDKLESLFREIKRHREYAQKILTTKK